jgi:catechol 2,3-dioxygenase-like lactoylglutathione lyase family enzyme
MKSCPRQLVIWRTRRWIFLILSAVELSIASAQRPGQEVRRPLVTGVAAVGMTVADIDRAVAFYSNVLLFKKISERYEDSTDHRELENVPGAKARVVRMRLGNGFIDLTQYLTPKGKPMPPDSMSNDLWFQHLAIVVSNMEKAYERLRQNRVEPISDDGPQRLPQWNLQAAGIVAFYFKDPDGHPLELLHFPPGKGDPEWHGKTDELFLGIDHTAIAVSHTDKSLIFYRRLGFRERGHSLNYGIEQERLSGVAGARVRITSLCVSAGPGIELLEYQSPPTGRPMPTDERANDLLHHQTVLVTNDLRSAIEAQCTARVSFVSTGTFCDGQPTSKSRHSVLIRDPDGHVMELVGK